jgi:hypothetical protein
MGRHGTGQQHHRRETEDGQDSSRRQVAAGDAQLVPGAAARSRDTYLSAQFWRLARRVGKKKAAVAVGHSILVICWHLLTNNCDYDDLGGDYFARRTNPDRHRDHLIERLHTLGYRVSTKSHERTATRSTGERSRAPAKPAPTRACGRRLRRRPRPGAAVRSDHSTLGRPLGGPVGTIGLERSLHPGPWMCTRVRDLHTCLVARAARHEGQGEQQWEPLLAGSSYPRRRWSRGCR